MKPNGIIIDFDYTLFDASALKNALAAAIEGLGIHHDAFWKTYSEIRAREETAGYSPARHLEALNSVSHFDREKAETKFNEVVMDSRRYLYPDAVPFLEKLSKLSPLLLLSRGDRGFQQKKISACNIQKYFTKIELTEKEKNCCLKDMLEKYGDSLFFVNDSVKETRDALREFPNIRPVIRRRSDMPEQDYLKESIPNFNTLKEIKEFILMQYAR